MHESGKKMAKMILIVDDSASLRTVVKMALTGAGYDVIEAGDGNEALKLMDGRVINMIISDINMPGMNGLEFCKQAKMNPTYKFTPILMLTTESSTDKKDIAKSAGASAWMTKPFSPTQMVKAVEKLAK